MPPSGLTSKEATEVALPPVTAVLASVLGFYFAPQKGSMTVYSSQLGDFIEQRHEYNLINS